MKFVSQLFRCIKGHLRKQGKLVVLVTHQVQYVTECDTILALKNVRLMCMLYHVMLIILGQDDYS